MIASPQLSRQWPAFPPARLRAEQDGHCSVENIIHVDLRLAFCGGPSAGNPIPARFRAKISTIS